MKSDKAKAIELFEEFTGHTAQCVGTAIIPDAPPYLVEIGRLEAVGYYTVRDGKRERYLHEFAAKSAPVLCCSPDGSQLYIVDGRYQFTDQGIVDK